MKRNVIKKLGIVIMSAMIIASPVATPFTTMTVYAEELVDNDGEIATNVGTIGNNNGTIETNATEGYVINNNGTIGTNASEAYVINNNGTIGTSGGTVTNNNGTIGTSAGNVDKNYGGATIENNYGVVQTNKGTIKTNYGIVEINNEGTVENNYTTTVEGTGIVNGGTVTNQWYEVKLENNTTEIKIKGDSIQDIDDSGNIDVFAKKESEITIYSINPAKIINAIEGDIEYVKNSDGSITIRNIQNPYSLLTTLADKIFESAPSNNESDNKEEVVIEISTPEAPAQIATPARTINMTSIVAENPEAAIMVAKTLQNDPAVVEQAQKLTVYMEAVTAVYKEHALKELAAAPNQAVVGSSEYLTKQVAIIADLTSQMASLNKLTVQSLAVAQKTGVSVATGGCTKLEAANVALLNEILAKGIPVTFTYATKGKTVTINIPADANLTKFIDAFGRLDFTKLKAYIVK
ncbi:MAG: hypothetical protein MJZ11_12945 [Lachnospiraceae bacterium]|nr:hypothetical protein [Lachnospiraceae bacterium]